MAKHLNSIKEIKHHLKKKIINYDVSLVSIIIIRHEENKNIMPIINSIKDETYRKVEILVGDCCIEDDTELTAYISSDRKIIYEKYDNIDESIKELSDRALGEYMNIILSEVQFSTQRIETMMNIILESEKIIFVASDNADLNNIEDEIFKPKNENDNSVLGNLISKNTIAELLKDHKVNFLNQCSGVIFKSSFKKTFLDNYKVDYFRLWSEFMKFGHGFYVNRQLIASHEKQELFFTYLERSSEESWVYYTVLKLMTNVEKDALINQWCESLFYSIAEDIAGFKCEKKKNKDYRLPLLLADISEFVKNDETLKVPNTALAAIKSLDEEYCIANIDRDKVLFSCVTVYHLFTSAILSEIYYKDKKKVLILSNLIESAEKLYENLKKSCIWDQVILFDEKRVLDSHSAEEYKELFLECGTLHYFTFGTPLNESIISLINPNTKMILTDEGLMTYFIKEFLPGYIINRGYTARQIKLDFADEVWVYNKDLIISEFEQPVREIQMPEKEKLKPIVQKLNLLFNYNPKPMEEGVLFFDQYFEYSELFTKEDEITMQASILNVLDKQKTFVKKHPRIDISKYNNTSITIMENSDLPWELLRLNELMENQSKPRVFVTYFSTAILTDFMIGKKYSAENNSYILLEKIIKEFGYHEDLKFLYKIIEKLENNFHKKIYLPETIDQLSEVFEQVK
ncbi:hypothetical protein [Clostridium cellulovorans]|uniref:Glycosyltransferase 2-like domain-containing protein n=1 Tax=Clostridium cellulovorans (strain ATCC 35296 / DSM 3052 / OCM 3 / 743B) TaxID=573061 RepID=D9SPV8_CLOC7|nr:hypothetical protein [Clostridium cellulovorans]ADL52094.1 hypothetical protein Clocel_2378 [Clostridium cellulovorans 743B]